MAEIAPLSDSVNQGDYKYQWARYLSRKSLDYDVRVLQDKLSNIRLVAPSGDLEVPIDILPIPQTGQSLRQMAKDRPVAFGPAPEVDGQFKMGIIGAGVAGLFTALLIDWLNAESKGKLKIDYDILEAGDQKRVGGRLYTHYFSEGPDANPHDYYDVGAMRFPKNQVMERTFRLFNMLDIKEGKGKGKLRRYYFMDQEAPNGVCPSYYNDVRKVGSFAQYNAKGETDPFGVNNWIKGTDPESLARKIPEELIKQDPGSLVSTAIEDYVKALRKDLDARPRKSESDNYEGWDKLMDADYMSTREFLREKAGKDGKGYNFNTIEWMETFALATGWYNQSLAETVLEELDFDKPNDAEKSSNDYWWCIDGGTQQVATKIVERLKGKKPECNRQVAKITNDRKGGQLTLTINSVKDGKTLLSEDRSYFTVFNSTTLGALQRMDLSQADLNYGTKQAIRSLNYGASCKVGMKFKTGWWMKEPYNIKQGGLGKTDLPLRVCVYPSYNVDDPVDKPMVLLCSYSWAQDAQRLGGLINPNSPQGEDQLKELMLENLARLHAPTPEEYPKLLKQLQDEYITHYAYDWYHDPNMLGAFGYFGPGQFSQMWPEIIKPSGWLFLIGEAASAHHGWICGALESSVRAVYQLLFTLQMQGEQQKGADWSYTGYKEAIELLVGDGKVTENDPPFIGLPKEMPHRQLGTPKEKPTRDSPKIVDPKVDFDLSFTAAQVITSFYELVVEIAQAAEQVQALRTEGGAAAA